MEKEKNLIIVRHAKSSWDIENIDDKDRPLKQRGIYDAHKMGGRLAALNLNIDSIYSSNAVRASHTASIFARVLNIPCGRIILNESIYDSDEQDLLTFVKNLDNSQKTVMIFGHNPTCTIFVNHFLSKSIGNLPTSGLAVFSFSTETWANIGVENMIRSLVDYPKKNDK